MVSQVLEDLQVLGYFFLAISHLIHITLTHAFDCYKVAAEFMLCNHNFTESTLTELVSNTIELMCCCHWPAHLLKISYDHGDQVLFVLEQRVINLIEFIIVVEI